MEFAEINIIQEKGNIKHVLVPIGLFAFILS